MVNYDNLLNGIMEAVNATNVTLSLNGRVVDMIIDNHKVVGIVDLRSKKEVQSGIYSFSEEFMQDMRATHANYIFVHSDSGDVVVINPHDVEASGFRELATKTELGEKIRTYIQID